MRRFFFDPALQEGDRVRLSEEESYHIGRVLRLRPGTGIEVMDGLGGVYAASILEIDRQVVVRLLGRQEAGGLADVVQLWVGQGLLKGKKMDGTVQQCTELGVARFLPFFSRRCQGSLGEMRERQKTERWDRIVISACKQCKRHDLMLVEHLSDYAALTSQFGDEPGLLRLIFWEEEEEFHLKSEMFAKGMVEKVFILLGPEGGFTGEEVAAARNCGWQPVSLGQRILRAETATLTAVALVQYLTGNL